jgi:small subunit ribosomal protein S16
MLKIRLRRIGKKRTPYYRVVVAEKEAKRDGAFLETLGSYDPHANPPSAVIDEEKTRSGSEGCAAERCGGEGAAAVGILEAPVKVESKKAAPAAKGKKGAAAGSRSGGEGPCCRGEGSGCCCR